MRPTVNAEGGKHCLSVYRHIKPDFPFPFLFLSEVFFIFMLISRETEFGPERRGQFMKMINDTKNCSILPRNVSGGFRASCVTLLVSWFVFSLKEFQKKLLDTCVTAVVCES